MPGDGENEPAVVGCCVWLIETITVRDSESTVEARSVLDASPDWLEDGDSDDIVSDGLASVDGKLVPDRIDDLESDSGKSVAVSSLLRVLASERVRVAGDRVRDVGECVALVATADDETEVTVAVVVRATSESVRGTDCVIVLE